MISIHIRTFCYLTWINTSAFWTHGFFPTWMAIIHTNIVRHGDVCISIVSRDWGFFCLSLLLPVIQRRFLMGNLVARLNEYLVLLHAFSHTHTSLQMRENLLEFDPILEHLLKIAGKRYLFAAWFLSIIYLFGVFAIFCFNLLIRIFWLEIQKLDLIPFIIGERDEVCYWFEAGKTLERFFIFCLQISNKVAITTRSI